MTRAGQKAQQIVLLLLFLVQLNIFNLDAENHGHLEYEIVVGSHRFDLNALMEDDVLQYLEREELSILRNAVFAKHGYKFRTAKFHEIFSSYDWYKAEHDDVSGMLTWKDLRNIELIRKYEIGEIVHTVSHADSSSGGILKVEFYLRGSPSYSDCAFTGFKIYEVVEGSKKKVFDSNSIDEELCAQLDSIELAVQIEDRNGDGSEELYFDVSDPISPVLLLVDKIDGRYVALYHEPTYGISYRDIDADGIPELLSNHLGGGGFVSWWQGLLLVNTLEDTAYAFSYELTRTYYEEELHEAEIAFSEKPDAARFALLLNAHADLGNFAACTTLVRQHQDLATLDREFYEEHIDGPDEDLIGFTVYRAAEYERIWLELRER